jgi:cell division protein FtsL
MSISIEIAIVIIINLVSIGIWVGSISSFKKHINYRLDKLEAKQDKHNNLIERMAIVEQSTKSAHHRIDDMKTELKNELENKK